MSKPAAPSQPAPTAAPAAPAAPKESAAQPAAPAAAPAAKAGAMAKLPEVVNWVTLDVGSATYNVHQAVAHAVSGREKITIRLVPLGSDLGRLQIYREGRADFGNDPGVTAYEGLAFYATAEAGPSPVRLVAANWPKTNTLVGCAGDIGVKYPQDLKGKRMLYIANAFGFNISMEATLAAGGLTWDDVKRVDIPSYGGAGRAIMEDKADCTWTATNTGFIYEMASSPRGWAPIHMKSPEEDPAMWQRFLKVHPVNVYGKATVGAAPVSDDNPHHGVGNQFASISALASKDAEYVYQMAKAIYEAFPDFNGTYPGVEGYDIGRQRFDGLFIPLHDGTVRYFKEKGIWTPQAEERQQMLLKREPVVQAAWEKAKASGANLSGDDWDRHWMKIRVESLKAAGMEPYYEEPYWLRLR